MNRTSLKVQWIFPVLAVYPKSFLSSLNPPHFVAMNNGRNPPAGIGRPAQTRAVKRLFVWPTPSFPTGHWCHRHSRFAWLACLFQHAPCSTVSPTIIPTYITMRTITYDGRLIRFKIDIIPFVVNVQKNRITAFCYLFNGRFVHTTESDKLHTCY